MSASLAAAFPVAAARAQTDSSGARRESSSEAVPRVLVAGGVDADGQAGTAYPPQLALHVGYQLLGGRRVGGSRFGLRAGLDFTASTAESESLRLQGPFQTRRSRGLGVVLLGTYALARGPVRPYLIAGGGLYALHSVATYQSAYGYSASGRPAPDGKQVADGTHAGASVGAGISAPVGRVVLFGEARATIIPTAGLSDTPGFRGTQFPLTLGVRF